MAREKIIYTYVCKTMGTDGWMKYELAKPDGSTVLVNKSRFQQLKREGRVKFPWEGEKKNGLEHSG